MPAIIEVSGPSAVGKTTMIEALAPEIGAVVVPEVLQGTSYRLPKPTSVYLKARRTDPAPPAREPHTGQGGAAGDSATCLIDSGVADVLSFAKHFPPARGLDWDITGDLARAALARERRLGLSLTPDVLLYLTASQPTIRARRGADTATSRRDHDENVLLVPYEDAYFRRLAGLHPGTVFIIEAEAGREEVLRQAVAAVGCRQDGMDGTRARPRLRLQDLLRALGWEGEVAPVGPGRG